MATRRAYSPRTSKRQARRALRRAASAEPEPAPYRPLRAAPLGAAEEAATLRLALLQQRAGQADELAALRQELPALRAAAAELGALRGEVRAPGCRGEGRGEGRREGRGLRP